MDTLFTCSEIESYAKYFYELVNLLENPNEFINCCEDYGWKVTERLDWVPAVTFSISETEEFSLTFNYSFPEDELNNANAAICGITYYNEETNTALNKNEIQDLDKAFEEEYFNFLSQMESQLGKASRYDIYNFSDRKLNYASWEQNSGLLILQQTLGDLHCGIDWEIHISLYLWRANQKYPNLSM